MAMADSRSTVISLSQRCRIRTLSRAVDPNPQLLKKTTHTCRQVMAVGSRLHGLEERLKVWQRLQKLQDST